ncbi:MobA/MobL family protein [uncultured Sphingomonas sp.]|uniref:MobA/MobL family protein n=1 Tax=uncultured Sphingomonas sp. TaxID=158754 RepID=UPI0025E14705|nr:MobA/MobL family protein [uncultured Sphingomonas sp.]
MASQLAFAFAPPGALPAEKAVHARAAIAKYAALPSDEDITGRETDVLKILHRSVANEPQRHTAPERARRPSSSLPPARFHQPRPPRGRPCTADGRVSFHLEFTTVTKGVGGVCRTNDGRAADPAGHVEYVGREDAVATNAPEETFDPLVHEAVAHVGYVSRDTAVATDGDGTAIVLTNIDGEASAFFATVVQHEDIGHPDGICVAEPLDIAKLRALTQDSTIPSQLKSGIERIMADPNAYRVERSGSPKSKTHPLQTDADIAGCAAWLSRHNATDLVHLRKGRGGIVQRRVTGELPAELGAGGCRKVLKKLAKEFDRRGLRYYVALHAPTAANHDRNWHFHLLYYDRPCERIGDAGHWDFTIAQERRTSSRNRTRSYPHRQLKHKDVRAQNWPMYLRTSFAEAVNVELARTSSRRRYDPRRYEDMNINAEPQKHLARGVAFHAACGAAPTKERENARKGWSWRVRQLLLQHDQIDKDDEYRIKVLRAVIGQDAKHRNTLALLERRMAEQRAEARTGDVILKILHPMARSNAEQTAEKMNGYATELADKLVARGQRTEHHPRHAAFKQRERDAQAYIAELERTFAPETRLATSLVSDAQQAREQIDVELDVLYAAARFTRSILGESPPAVTTALRDEAAAAGTKGQSPSTTPVASSRPPAPSPTVQPPMFGSVSAEVDDWIGRINRHRRLTRRDGRVEPFRLTDRDRHMLGVASPAQLKELDRIRDQQNRLIARISAAVEAAPAILTIPVESYGKWTIAHADRAIQDGLRRYIVDPSVQDRLRTAQQTGMAHRSAMHQASTSAAHRAVDGIPKAGVAVHRIGDAVAIRDADAVRLGVTHEELRAQSVQRRLAGILRTQENAGRPVAPQVNVAPPPSDYRPIGQDAAPRPAASTAPEAVMNSRVPTPTTTKSDPPRPVAPSHPLVISWQEAHAATIRPGGPITVAERNRRAAVALKDKLAAEELRRLGPDVLAAATAQASDNHRYLQRAGNQFARLPRIG